MMGSHHIDPVNGTGLYGFVQSHDDPRTAVPACFKNTEAHWN